MNRTRLLHWPEPSYIVRKEESRGPCRGPRPSRPTPGKGVVVPGKGVDEYAGPGKGRTPGKGVDESRQRKSAHRPTSWTVAHILATR